MGCKRCGVLFIEREGWAFVTALTAGGAHVDDILLPEGQLYYHNRKVLLSEMNQFACSLDHFRSAEDMPETTVRQFVEEGLANSGLPYAPDEVRSLFGNLRFTWEQINGFQI